MFEICKRFALTDVLFAEEKPFMILDDPFYNLDDEKVKNSLELVEKLSKDKLDNSELTNIMNDITTSEFDDNVDAIIHTKR